MSFDIPQKKLPYTGKKNFIPGQIWMWNDGSTTGLSKGVYKIVRQISNGLYQIQDLAGDCIKDAITDDSWIAKYSQLAETKYLSRLERIIKDV